MAATIAMNATIELTVRHFCSFEMFLLKIIETVI